MKQHKTLLKWLCFLLFVKAVVMAFVILYSGIGLGPDEAQYWTWSQKLDWGYYSKPPGIAWELALGTSIFGNSELGIRLMPMILAYAIPIAVYTLARACLLTPLACFYSGLVFAFTPVGMMASFLAITDGGLVLFWTLASAYFAFQLNKRQLPNYVVLGLLIACGALFKWPAYLLWMFVFTMWLFYPWLISWRILLGMSVSLLGLLPSFYWNLTHEGATFRHVYATLQGGSSPNLGATAGGNFWEFIGAQILLFSPIFFALFVGSLFKLHAKKRSLSPALVFSCLFVLFTFTISSLIAIQMKLQGNWIVFIYPSAVVLLCWYACDEVRWGKKWMISGALLSCVLLGGVLAIPRLQSSANLAIPYRFNAFRHNVGWEKLDSILRSVGYDPKEDFLFSDKYQTTSTLSYYGPSQQRAYFFNLQGIRKNQFSFWGSMDEECRGKRGFFVFTENTPHLERASLELPLLYKLQLKPYFQQVKFLGLYPLFTVNGTISKAAFIFECTNYQGGEPEVPQLY